MSINEIISLLDDDPSSSDFLISILWTAATNYKHDTLLRPFPPLYIREEQKDVDTLVRSQNIKEGISESYLKEVEDVIL